MSIDPKTMQELSPEQEAWLMENSKPMTEEDEKKISKTLADLKEQHRALEKR